MCRHVVNRSRLYGMNGKPCATSVGTCLIWPNLESVCEPVLEAIPDIQIAPKTVLSTRSCAGPRRREKQRGFRYMATRTSEIEWFVAGPNISTCFRPSSTQCNPFLKHASMHPTKLGVHLKHRSWSYTV